MSEAIESYPASLDIEYSGESDKLTCAFRVFTAIPAIIILVLLVGGEGPGIVFAPTLLMILFRRKYPRWWFDWNVSLTRFCARVLAYFILLRDEYPATDQEQAVHLEIHYPDAENELKRGLPLVKWFLAIPHLVILQFLYIAVVFCTIVSWFAILFTGAYPRVFFDFTVGVMRWTVRVLAYSFLLTTDRYPPFRLYD